MEQEQFYRYSMDHALEMILVFDRNGTILYSNEKADTLLEYEQGLCQTSITNIFYRFADMDMDELVSECSTEKKTLDLMAYRSNKTCFPVMVQVLQMEDMPQQYLCMALDMSNKIFMEKKMAQIEQGAQDALKVKSEFVANVTHELRTPVNGFLGNTKELESREQDPDKLKILKMLERGCQDMNSIINNILDFSKLEAGKFTLEMRKFNFRDMIDYVKSNHNNKITEKGLDFFVTISPDIPEYIIGDELRIVQILNNLLSNACKFTSVGKISLEIIKTMQVNNRMELFFIVMDTGIGIKKEDQDKLFQSFSQVDASITRRYGGTGLGLNICKQLVELMEGSIHVESEPNKGSMFTCSLWVEILPDEEQDVSQKYVMPMNLASYQTRYQAANDSLMNYGAPENLHELDKRMSKLILAVEMENWEKGAMFLEAIKQLTEGAPKEIKSAMLKLKMAVQKEDYEKTLTSYDRLHNLIEASKEGAYES